MKGGVVTETRFGDLLDKIAEGENEAADRILQEMRLSELQDLHDACTELANHCHANEVRIPPLQCSDFERIGLWNTNFCCSSCHEDDEEYGYPLSERYSPARGQRESKAWAQVCCQFEVLRGDHAGNEVPLTRDDFAAALRARGARLGGRTDG